MKDYKPKRFYDRYEKKRYCPECFNNDLIRLRYDFYQCRKCETFLFNNEIIGKNEKEE